MLFVGKDATDEFDMVYDRKVSKRYGIDPDLARRDLANFMKVILTK